MTRTGRLLLPDGRRNPALVMGDLRDVTVDLRAADATVPHALRIGVPDPAGAGPLTLEWRGDASGMPPDLHGRLVVALAGVAACALYRPRPESVIVRALRGLSGRDASRNPLGVRQVLISGFAIRPDMRAGPLQVLLEGGSVPAFVWEPPGPPTWL